MRLFTVCFHAGRDGRKDEVTMHEFYSILDGQIESKSGKVTHTTQQLQKNPVENKQDPPHT